MKKIIALIVCYWVILFSGILQAQGQTISITSDSFDEYSQVRISNAEGWYYHAGDDTTWANPEISLDEWEPVNNIDMRDNNIPENWSGNGWFRAGVKIDTALFGKEMGIRGRIYGAMEIYLNGKIAGKAGTIGMDSQSEESAGYFEPIIFSWDSTDVQHITIRYSNHNYREAWGHAPIGPILYLGKSKIIFNHYEQQQSEYESHITIYRIQIGFFLALALLHLILFGYYPSERSNLIYGVMMLAVAVVTWSSTLLGTLFKPDDFLNYVIVESVSTCLFAVLNVFFVYRITGRKANGVTNLFLAIGVILALLMVIEPIPNRGFVPFFLYLSFLIAIGIFVWDRIKHHRKDLNIILYSYLLFFILFFPRTFYIATDIHLLWAGNQYLYNYFAFIIPIGYSVYLARSVAKTNSRLSKKLEENEKLASEKIAVEREKQQLIQSQKEKLEKEVTARTAELEQSLRDLKSTQQQLVQQEKLASLGQLTAGIAHEIKNPLNFVNNFSELSVELIEEAREELSAFSLQLSANGEHEKAQREMSTEKGETKKSPLEGSAGVNAKAGDVSHVNEALKILNDIEANLRKIHEHGSRADSIVKSMLQHSRGGSGKMEPTNLNALVKEYVNLSFHGMRAGKNPINVDMQFDLDESIGKVPLIAEDFSRVIVNLCNNAFDAMREKGIQNSELKIQNYSPKLTVRTQQTDSGISIEIEDNGSGIPEEMKDKILQPFFTTKKGTEGTGLGLSITHDIVKAHGGEMQIESQKNEYTCFKITLIA